MIKNKKIYEKVMIFGVFDGLHDGHKFFIKNAEKYSKILYIVVTPTKTVKVLKDKLPYYSINERMNEIKKEYPKSIVIEGDNVPGKWTIIEKYKPNIIICGYDQIKLYSELEKIKKYFNFDLIKIDKNFKGDILHSSLLQKNI